MTKGKRSEKQEKNKLILLIVVVVVLAILGLSIYEIIEYKANQLLDGYSLYNSENYTVQYKSDWTNAVSDTSPNMTVFSSPDGAGIINITTEQLTAEYTLDQFVDDSINLLKSNFHLVASDIGKEKISINGKDEYRISYNANETTRITQTILLSNGTAYAISYNSTLDYFDVYHNMENTLKVKWKDLLIWFAHYSTLYIKLLLLFFLILRFDFYPY